MHPAELSVACEVENLPSLHRVLDSLDSANVGCISVCLHSYTRGCVGKVLAFSTVCGLRSRSKRLDICGTPLFEEISDDPLEEELLAIIPIWSQLSADIQAFHRHDVAVNMLSPYPMYW